VLHSVAPQVCAVKRPVVANVLYEGEALVFNAKNPKREHKQRSNSDAEPTTISRHFESGRSIRGIRELKVTA
jgi:hypothetical protein